MTDRIQMSLVGLYVAGWFIDWTYWIAVGWENSVGEISTALPVIWGWVVALFWPLHLGFEIWTAILQ